MGEYGMGAEVLEPPAFGTSVPPKISPYIQPPFPFVRPFQHCPFPTLHSSQNMNCCKLVWLFWLSLLHVFYEYLHLSITCYTRNDKVTDDVALLGGYKYDCCTFLSNSDHQVRIQDLEIVCPWILKHSPIHVCPRRQQELKICFSMDNAKPDLFKFFLELFHFWITKNLNFSL